MNYTREIVSTVDGQIRVMTGEMRNLMKSGLERKLVPMQEFKGPRLKLDKESKVKILSQKKEITRIRREISRLEYIKAQPYTTPDELEHIERQIELCHFDMFEARAKIQEIKKDCYKNQLSTIDFDA